jgi:hypothetical protein
MLGIGPPGFPLLTPNEPFHVQNIFSKPSRFQAPNNWDGLKSIPIVLGATMLPAGVIRCNPCRDFLAFPELL